MMGPFCPPPKPHSKYIIMVQLSLAKKFVCEHVCMHIAAYLFLQRPILYPIKTVDNNSGWGLVVLLLSR